ILPILGYVHRHNVIHRDIKPPNIIRCQDHNRLVLIDFGAVKDQIAQLDDASTEHLSTQFVGTVGFAPPEQLALRPTFSSDIYSIGVTCLYLLTGKPPLEFDYDVETGEIKWQEDAPVSHYFRTVLAKMLKMSASDRYQTVEEVQRALALEPHLSDLAECMNSKPLQQDAEDAESEGLTEAYLSPMAREARAIRHWRQRTEKRQNHRNIHTNRALVNSYRQ
ncbi:MAG: protein kinase, partial [Symploca sp. SIO3C6]|nr:protein kinase [Symploca sp. SIO3C6]